MAVQLVTIEQLSMLIDLSPRQIHRLAEQGTLKRAVDDQGKQVRPTSYELIPTVRAYCAYLREVARVDDVGHSTFQKLRNKKIGAEAEKAVLDLQLHKKKLHKDEDVQYVMTTMLTSVKSRLLSIPSRITRVLMGKTSFQEIYAIIDAEVELALRELSDYDPNAFARANDEYLSLTGQTPGPHPNGSANHQGDPEDAGIEADAIAE
jgi:phage terminase Nu1 subunit (DNA packaging protein)